MKNNAWRVAVAAYRTTEKAEPISHRSPNLAIYSKLLGKKKWFPFKLRLTSIDQT